MIRLREIDYRAGARSILTNVSLKVMPGEFCAIAGPHGAGKSSLLGIATGSLRPSAGTIELGDLARRRWKPVELARKAAVLHQKSSLNLPFSVHEVVAMGRYPHQSKGAKPLDDVIIENVLRQCGILHLAGANYTLLSGGEQQRVQLARVFAQVWNPGDTQVRYLFLDEPGNNLDIRFQHESLALARAFADAGNCVLAVLHDLNLIMQYADTALLLKAGRELSSGRVSDAFTEGSITEAFDYPVRFLEQGDGLPVIVPEAGFQKHYNNQFQSASL